MSNIAFLFLLLAFSSLPAVLPFVSPSSQVYVSAQLLHASEQILQTSTFVVHKADKQIDE